MTHCHMCWPVGGCAVTFQSPPRSQSSTPPCPVGTIWNVNPTPYHVAWKHAPAPQSMQTALSSGPNLCSTWS